VSARVLISIVTYNENSELGDCFDALRLQTFHDHTVVLWDNGSNGETREIVKRNRDILAFTHFSDINAGYSLAHNRLIETADSEYVLTVNPDVVLEPHYLENLVTAMDRDPGAGSATGKLIRKMHSSAQNILDSTGIYMTPNQRHFDRGAGEIDRGQYDRSEYVFGASGAAAMYRRKMLQDIRYEMEYLDESFFAYREDADLAWRAQWAGWRCIYVPDAVAQHKRRVRPENRRTLPDAINMHSFKNRFLLRAKNMDWGTYARFFLPITFRDAAALAYVLGREWSSLPGIPATFRALPRAIAWRKFIRSRRRAAPAEIQAWFSYTPISYSTDVEPGLRPGSH
jgi:GT2 family glycosyltransferase